MPLSPRPRIALRPHARAHSYLGRSMAFSSPIISSCKREFAWVHLFTAIVGLTDFVRMRAAICSRPRQLRTDLALAFHWLNLFSLEIYYTYLIIEIKIMHNYYYGTKNLVEMINFHFETYFIYQSK